MYVDVNPSWNLRGSKRLIFAAPTSTKPIKDRYCRWCGAKLSRYNRNDYCSSCQAKRRELIVQGFLEF